MGLSRQSTQLDNQNEAGNSPDFTGGSSSTSKISKPAMQRGQTLPTLPTSAKDPKVPPPSIQTSDYQELTEDEKSEICLSPSWSDHGGAKRKKDKKRREKEQKRLDEERKVTQKGIKKELEKQKIAMMKEQKRLSKKPPPAAMDTQRMPAALRRNSSNSIRSFFGSGSSRDPQRRRPSSEEGWQRERRWSFGSTRSKQSDTEPSDDEASPASRRKPIVSSNAPQLPKLTLGWHSRNASSGSDRGGSGGSEDAQGKDFFKLAYKVDTGPTSSPKASQAQSPDVQQDRTRTSFSKQDPLRIRALPRSQTDSQLYDSSNANPTEPPTGTAIEPKTESKASIGNPRSPDRKRSDSVPRIRQSPSQRARDVSASRAESHRRVSVEKPDRPIFNPLSAHPVNTARPRDGGSYVHKQRMYQQQRSIQGYEDEQAVIAANLANVAAETPQPDATTEPPPASTAPIVSNQGPAVLNRLRPPQLAGTKAVKTAKAQLHEGSVEIVSARASMAPITPKDASFDEIGGRRESTKSRTDGDSPVSTKAQGQKPTTEGNVKAKQGGKRLSSPPPNLETTKPAKRPPVPPISQPSTYRCVSVPSTKPLDPPKVFLRPDEVVRASLDPSAPAEYELSDKRRTVGDFTNHSRTRTSSSQLLLGAMFSPKTTETSVHPTTTASMQQQSVPPPEAKSEISMNVMQAGDKAVAKSGKPKQEKSNNMPKSPIPTLRQNTDPGPVQNEGGPAIERAQVKPSGPEVVVETTTGEGIVRKTSIKRSRSNPQLNTVPPTPTLPSLDFLPQLKHQPLPKPKRTSQSPQRPLTISVKSGGHEFPMPPASPTVAVSSDLRIQPRSPLRLAPSPTTSSSSTDFLPSAAKPRRRNPFSDSTNNALISRNSAFGPLAMGRGAPGGLDTKPLAKLFVICCKCKFWHDLPSKLYAAMSVPQVLSRDVPSGVKTEVRTSSSTSLNGDGASQGTTGTKTEQAQLDTMVKCPWCEHLMTTWCCAGWTTVVYLHERHH